MPLYVGHVNGTFKYREVNEKNSKEILHCPYNFRHQVPFEVFQKHLRACPDATAKKELVDSCEFNPVHFYPALDVEREIHLQICPNRRQAPVRERPEKKVIYRVTLPLCPLRERSGIENPRESQKPMPSVEDILGPEVRFVELEKNAAERMNRARKSTPFEEAIEDVMKNGPREYGYYRQYTSRMSRVEKVRFALYLDSKREQAERDAYYSIVVQRRYENL